MKSLTAVTILGTFAVIALVYSVACDEMGFEENEAGVVEVQEELSTCVCRVDGEIENPGDGKTWETACQTVDECVDRLETDPDVNKGCEVWVRQGTIVEGFPMDSSKLEAVSIAKNIRAYGGFKGTEINRKERIADISRGITGDNENPIVHRKTPQLSMPSELIEPEPMEIPTPYLLDDPSACAYCSSDDFFIDDGDDEHRYMWILSNTGKNGGIIFQEGDDKEYKVFHGADEDEFRIYNYNTGSTSFVIESSGQVGINQDWAYAALHVRGNSDSNTAFRVQTGNVYIKSPSKVGIGTTNYFSGTTYELAVNGKILAEEIVVDDVAADFVFEPGYKLRPLESVESYISQKGHLPDIPSAKDMGDGMGLGRMSTLLLQKVEELTLYAIEQKKEIDALKQEVRNLKKNHGATSSR